jgi:hypothetical protein
MLMRNAQAHHGRGEEGTGAPVVIWRAYDDQWAMVDRCYHSGLHQHQAYCRHGTFG